MVYVYAKLSKINKYLVKKLSVNEIEETLKDLGMDLKGITSDEDPELKIEITAEKIDMISIIGIARAINYYKGFKTDIPEYKVLPYKNRIIVDKSVKDIRPKTVAAIIRNINITKELLEELIDIQEKIHASFGRGRKKVAIGIYPLKEIEFPIKFIAKKPEEIKFQPLESNKIMNGLEIINEHHIGKKYKHLLEGKNLFPIFIDNKNNILSMPPIINSHNTGRVTTNDKDLFIECSGFNITYLDSILKNLTTIFAELGAEIEAVKIEYDDTKDYILNLENIRDEINLDYINSLIGIKLNKDRIRNLLSKAMYKLIKIEDNNKLIIEYPPYRVDIWNDCDIADDIARAYGYNNIIPKFPNISSIGNKTKFNNFKRELIKIMIGLGFVESYTYILTSTDDQFNKIELDKENFNYVKLINSSDQGINMCRINIFPEILKFLNHNKKHKYPQYVFECGIVIIPDNNSETGAINQNNLSVVIADNSANYTKIKSYFDYIIKIMNKKNIILRESKYSFLIDGRQAEIIYKNNNIGFIGELHPKILKRFNFSVPISLFEINLDKFF